MFQIFKLAATYPHILKMTGPGRPTVPLRTKSSKTTQWSWYLMLSYPFLHLSMSLFHPFPRLQHWYNFLIPRLLNPCILVRWVSQIQARKKPQFWQLSSMICQGDDSISFHRQNLIKLSVLLTIVVWMTLPFEEQWQRQITVIYWRLELDNWPQNKDSQSELPTISMWIMSRSWINHDIWDSDREETWYMTKRNAKIGCDHIGFHCNLQQCFWNQMWRTLFPLWSALLYIVWDIQEIHISYHIISYLINLRFIRGSKRPTIFHPFQQY